MTVTSYTRPMPGLAAPLRLAQVSDTHNGAFAPLLSALEAASPDLVCVTGDFLDRPGRTARGFALLSALSARFPTFVSLGNHEMKVRLSHSDLSARIAETGATLLDNTTATFRSLLIGGLSTGYTPFSRQRRLGPPPAPDLSFLDRFAAAPSPKLLLCHHPEYYAPYLQARDIPIILAGHAHGGQWNLFGRGVFAPGQGLFPPYTHGIYDGRLIVSRGLCTTHRYIPSIANPRELVLLTLEKA